MSLAYNLNAPARKVSSAQLVTYIRRNPGLTTAQLTRLLRGGTETPYTKASYNARLLKLERAGRIVRMKGTAANSDRFLAWRHYPISNQSTEI